MCKKQEILFLERRRPLLKFYDMYEPMENTSEWCESATKTPGKISFQMY